MKKIFTIVLLGAFSMVNAQAFSGKGDAKLNIGLTAQNGGSGIQASTDLGSYLLSGSHIEDVSFEYRFDAKARFNANLGNVLNISPKFDLYPGLNLGLKNFGGHLGARYFFSEGFGVFTEFSAPFAKYDKDAASKYNNSSSFSIGASFNL